MTKLQVACSDLPSQHICFHIVQANILHTPVPADINLTQKLLRSWFSVKCLSFSFWLLNLLPITFAHKQTFHFQIRKRGQYTYGNIWYFVRWKYTVKLNTEKKERIRFTPWWENLLTPSWQNLMEQNLCSRWKLLVLRLHLVGIKRKSSKPSHTWTVSPLKDFSQESVTRGSY